MSVAQPRAIIYRRVSTKRQAQGSSLPIQEQRCIALAEQYGYQVVETITDIGSAYQGDDLPGFDRLLALVRGREVEAVVLYAVDRLPRSTIAYNTLFDACETWNTAIGFAIGPHSGKFICTRLD